MISTAKRTALLLLLAAFLACQSYAAFVSGGGGWTTKYGFFEAFPAFFALSAADPVMLAGLIDFMVLATLVAIWMISELPRETRWSGRTWIWLLSYFVYPGLGAMLFFLWLHPRHRFMLASH
jgi:hypothetical protein